MVEKQEIGSTGVCCMHERGNLLNSTLIVYVTLSKSYSNTGAAERRSITKAQKVNGIGIAAFKGITRVLKLG